MFIFWFIGFATGYLCAQLGQLHVFWLSLPSLLFLALLAGILCYWVRRWRQVICFVFAFLWGINHNAPLLTTNLNEATAVRGNALQFLLSDRLVVAHGERYRVRSQTAMHGRVKTKARGEYFIFAKPPYLRAKGKRTFLTKTRAALRARLDAVAEPVRSWVLSIILGVSFSLPKNITSAFKMLGLLHILVISGLHITILANCCLRIVGFVSRLFYAVRLFTPVEYQFIHKVCTLAVVVVVILYGCLIGFSSPAQRAVLLFVVQYFCRSFSFAQKVVCVFFLQMLLFPVGFFSDSMLLSWGAYFIVVHCYRKVASTKNFLGKVGRLLLHGQLVIVVLIVCFFRELCLLSIPLNVLLLPVTPLLLLSAGMLLLPLPDLFVQVIVYVHSLFLQGLEWLASHALQHHWLWLRLDNNPVLHFCLLLVLMVVLLKKAVDMRSFSQKT